MRVLVFVLVSGCGLGWGGEDGQLAGTPTLGAGPYGKPPIDFATPADEPYVLADRRADLSDPSPLWRDDGGIRLWYGRRDVDGGASEIWHAGLPAITELPDQQPVRVLAADEAWEEGRVAAPSVVRDGDRLVMFYEAGETAPVIALADSTDDGASWRKRGPLRAGTGPGAALVGGQWWLAWRRPDGAIVWSSASAPEDLGAADAGVAVAPGERPGAFDAYQVGAPSLVARDVEGRVHLGLFYAGAPDPDPDAPLSIGYLGRFASGPWERFGDSPVLHPGAPGEGGPAVLLEPHRGILLFHERRAGVLRLAVAVHP